MNPNLKTKKVTSGFLTLVLAISTGMPASGYAQSEIETQSVQENSELSFEQETKNELILVEQEVVETQTESEFIEESESTEESEFIEESESTEEFETEETIEETKTEVVGTEEITIEQTTFENSNCEEASTEEFSEREKDESNVFTELCADCILSVGELDAIDFSSKRLLISADEQTIIDPQDILSDYDGVYLMQYETSQQAKYAYAYYYGKCRFVDVDRVVSAADGEDSANAASPMDAGENPMIQLQEAIAQAPIDAAGAVAVIDTGVNNVPNVIESVSMIGESTIDENGHGTRMAQLVVQQNPSVSIVSIKALGADGTGDLSAVYAAIRYAIEQKVSVINLSLSAVGTAENAALTSIIDEAIQSGIAVVGAAGNNGRDVRFYVPGNIKSAWIIGSANEAGQRRKTSNYGETVDFNVVAESTSEAAAIFSGYYTIYGAQPDEKLVFPTDYTPKESDESFDGPIIKHQVSYYNYQGSREDLVWISTKKMKTKMVGDKFVTYIGFAEDASSIQDIDVYVDFMSISNERKITDECQIDLTNMTVKIPERYRDCDLTVRWYMSNATYGYCYDVDANYMISNTPEKFRGAYNAIEGLNLEIAQQYVNGTYVTDFTHAADSINHSYVSYSTDEINIGDSFSITDGYTASLEDNNTDYTSREQAKAIFGQRAFANKAGELTGQSFLNHFKKVVRSSDKKDVSSWFSGIGGHGSGTLLIDADNDGHTDTQASAGLGWVFGTCAMNELEGQCPAFSGGRIICTGKDEDGTTYFFYYCSSPRAQYNGGSFSITPVLPKKGFLQVKKSSSDPTLSAGNTCYKFDGIQYTVYSDQNCTKSATVLTLDQNGASNTVELSEGTYYVKESKNPDGSGFALSDQVYPVSVTTQSTAEQPVIVSVQDNPLNDPFGILIYKEDSDGSNAFDLSGAEYTIRYYAGQYNMSNLPSSASAVWVIKTKKASSGYIAYLNDECVVSGSASYGKSNNGMYRIPLGTVTVQETKAPDGFVIEGATVSSAKTGKVLSGTNGVYLFNLVSEKSSVAIKCGNALSESVTSETAMTIRYKELQKRGGISVEKCDTDNKTAVGNASLSGIRFAIINSTGATIINKKGQSVANGEVVQIIETDEKGHAATGMRDLPIGIYTVKELRMDATVTNGKLAEGSSPLANSSYFWKDNQDQITISEKEIGKFVSAKTFYNAVVTAVPKLEKQDVELNKKASMAGVSFEGITFEIYNASKNAVWIEKKQYKPGEMILKVTADAQGSIVVKTAFPIGHYSIKETKANGQYTVDRNQIHYFDVVSKNGTGSVVYEKGNSAVIFKDRVVRSDMSLMKVNGETNEALSYVPFKITNTVTKETHYIITDANGKFSSKSGKTIHTNANDEILSGYGAKDTISQKVVDSLVKDSGVWFGLGSEGSMTKPNDQYGAFVYGTYTITELRTEKTKGMKMYSGTFTIAEDAKLQDLGTIRNIPMAIGTTLEDANGNQCTYAGPKVTLTDHVSYRNLETGKNYTLTGTLYAKDGEQLTEIVSEKVTFQPEKAEGVQDVVFEFDASSLAGKSVVAFEELTLDGRFCADHKDPEDEEQTVFFPEIRTHAEDQLTKSNHMGTDQKASIVDTVSYVGLLPGKEYTVSGILMNKDTKKPITDKNGNEITAKTVFVAKDTQGSVQVTFEFDASVLAGTAVVAFESCSYNGIEIAIHADIEDEEQTVYIPQIRTIATGKDTKDHLTRMNDIITIVDTVSYSGLEIGREYTVKGTLMDKITGDVLKVEGKEVIGETTFTPKTRQGTVEVVFTFAGVGLEEHTLTAFETLYMKERELAVHADINDEDQTVYIPKIQTKASDAITQINYTQPTKTATIIDTVSYSNLVPGKEYTMIGTLMNKKTNEPIQIDGQSVQSTTSFIAETAQGNVQVVFQFDALAIAGTTVVAFESCLYNDVEIAVHADIEDEEQTIYIPKIATTAVDQTSKTHDGVLSKNAVIEDEVFYENLIPGKEYTVNGTLREKETGEVLIQNGIPVTASETFIAEETSGSVTVTFEIDSTVLAGKQLVAFEELLYEGLTIAVHADLEDADQTVSYPAPEPEPTKPQQKPTEPPVITGDSSTPVWYIMGLLASIFAMVTIVALLKKQKTYEKKK